MLKVIGSLLGEGNAGSGSVKGLEFNKVSCERPNVHYSSIDT